jgi:hypothetical protein
MKIVTVSSVLVVIALVYLTLNTSSALDTRLRQSPDRAPDAIASVSAHGNLNVSVTPAQGGEPRPVGAISIRLYPDSGAGPRASVVVIVPDGRRVGRDVRTHVEYSEIPGCGSDWNSSGNPITGVTEPKYFELYTPAAFGDYIVEVIPGGRETCTLTVTGSYPDRPPDRLEDTGLQLADKVVRYRFHYAATGTRLVELPVER